MPEKIAISTLICEFDPLHLGHKEVLTKMRAAGGAVCCILSGNFVQRGAPAMLDKWSRARLALTNGADLVFELPLPWACAGAERFAAGGVSLAGALGAERLYFGAEVPDAARLSALAEALLSPEFPRALAAQADKGDSFALRRQRAAAALLGEAAAKALSLPNCILGVEYIKAIKAQGLSIQPVPIQRVGAGHGAHSHTAAQGAGGKSLSAEMRGELAAVDVRGTSFTESRVLLATRGYADFDGARGFLSAGQLREIAAAGGDWDGLVPDSTAQLVKKLRFTQAFPVEVDSLERAILCKLRAMPPEAFATLPDLSEGLENRLYRASRQACELEELYSLVKCKRYTHARVRRLVMHAFLGVGADLPALPPYLRLLGATSLGLRALRQRETALPLAVRAGDFTKLGPDAQRVFALEAAADDQYALAAPRPWPAGRDYREPLIKLP